MTYNATLGERVLKQICLHPETWNQTNWHCETSMCWGGWAFELSPEAGTWESDRFSTATVRLPSGDLTSVSLVARELLGLDRRRADAMFSADNDLADLVLLHEYFVLHPEGDLVPLDYVW